MYVVVTGYHQNCTSYIKISGFTSLRTFVHLWDYYVRCIAHLAPFLFRALHLACWETITSESSRTFLRPSSFSSLCRLVPVVSYLKCMAGRMRRKAKFSSREHPRLLP